MDFLTQLFTNATQDEDLKLEEALEASIGNKELLPFNCIPKVIGTLPRLYRRGSSPTSKIKDHFNDLPSLKRLYIDKALLSLYSSYTPKETASVVIFTWVIGDGWGDYFAQIETAKVLRKQFPNLTIQLLTLVHDKQTLPKTECSFPHILLPYHADPKVGWEKASCKTFSPQVIAVLQRASLILQIPTCFPHAKQLLADVTGPKHELVGEGGWIDTPHFHPNTGARCMGLHFLEKGIFIKEMPKTDFFAASKQLDERLISALFGKRQPTKKQISAYIASHRFNLAYIRYDSGLYLYIHALLKSLEKDQKDIDICFFNLKHLLNNFESQYRGIFEKYGIGNATLFYQGNTTNIPISSKGKALKLIHLEKVNHEHYLTLVSLAQDLVGCRGDGSIFEAISASKIFFLDIPYHERTFLKDLIALATYLLPNHPQAIAYLKLFLSLPQMLSSPSNNAEWVEDLEPPPIFTLQELGEAMGELLQSPQIAEGFTILNTTIQQNYAFNPVLCNLTQRALCHYDNPHLAILESVALDSYLHGEKSAREALLDIKNLTSI